MRHQDNYLQEIEKEREGSSHSLFQADILEFIG